MDTRLEDRTAADRTLDPPAAWAASHAGTTSTPTPAAAAAAAALVGDAAATGAPRAAAPAATPMVISAGAPWPLGAHRVDGGVNFAVASAHASAIDLCLYDATGAAETRLRLPQRTDDVFHGFVAGLGAGQIYGLRAHGPWEPAAGQRFNAAKLLLDPYTREIVGRFEWADAHKAFDRFDAECLDPRDNGAAALKARVVDDAGFDWGADRAPRIPLADSVIYELHVKGFSQQNPAVPEALRGRYAGLAHPASTFHLKQLGVTAVNLLPVHQHIDEERLVAMGLVNYWGYNTIGFFCPEPLLAAAAAGAGVRDEFRAMVKALHAEGIEVLLDVVFNHTAESDEFGPSIGFRGLDNAGSYRLDPRNRRHYENHTGCGNTVDIRRPALLRWVLDCLRFWVAEMHVDGFRFDLASVLGRGDHGFDAQSAFFTAIAQDPVLATVKLIAEPWDIGPGGYQVGAFPRGWVEWNDRFRDDVRGFWLRGIRHRGALACRLCASSDLFEASGRAPAASLNYVVSHDGFTLRDLVSYEHKRNDANGEGNRDGTTQNYSVNCGAEGPSDDLHVNALRGRLQRALLAVTLFAQGTPMLSQGDELGHSQGGNNNPYCQDNPTTWIDWHAADAALFAFTARAIGLRRSLQPFANRWYGAHGADSPVWSGGTGEPLDAAAWEDHGHRALGCHIRAPSRAGRALMLLMNGSDTDVAFMLPPGTWTALLDSSHPRGEVRWADGAGKPYPLQPLSVVLLAQDDS